MKLAVIGGGSTYTPELVSGIGLRADRLAVDEVVLVDPDRDRLAVLGRFCARLLRALDRPVTLRWTDDLDDGLDGADGVLLQLRVGGQAARQRDECWPPEYGCLGQETTGVGGLAKAMRTVPVVLDIAERARHRSAPGAWIIDFTNPVGIVTRALLDAGHRAVGLCNVAIGMRYALADILAVGPDRIALDHVGLNHLTWVRAVRVDGRDRLPELLADHAERIGRQLGLPPRLLHDTGTIPSSYLRYFYRHDEEVARGRSGPTRAEEVARVERDLLAAYADPARDRVPDLLGARGGAHYSEAAMALLDSLVRDVGDVQVANVRNAGTFDFLPDEAVIEVPAEVGAGGVRPLRPAPPAPLLRGLIAHVSAYEELALDAALHGGRDRVRAALLAHPLVGRYDLAGKLTDRLLAENASYLNR
ncbi:6-phospho-beta-glucosidase [Micromonospora sp. NPDC018662]|uniref:family 4 glycosyl hydrolase n=1 Tax=Micromonospora sp. NPDC018662 TaxID=3364238 RepID=UPI0037ACCCBC